MKIWEILKRENIGKKYETRIYGGIKEVVKVDYDINSDSWLTVKGVSDNSLTFPLNQLYLGVILELEFEEI